VDHEAFQTFYTSTSAQLSAYLVRATRDFAAVDDIVQESYYRLLRTTKAFDGDDHRRRYLFRIATNLVHDRHRSAAARYETPLHEATCFKLATGGNVSQQMEQRADLAYAMTVLTSRERDLVRLAYSQGSTHHEIAGALGLQTGSIKPMLFRARRKLARSLTSSVRSRVG
jgi:RNA polymerase sigma-70 factor (ECF subfamily)